MSQGAFRTRVHLLGEHTHSSCLILDVYYQQIYEPAAAVLTKQSRTYMVLPYHMLKHNTENNIF